MTVTAGADSPYESIVGELERVELAARERRLTAETEAEEIRAAAAVAVADIEAGVPARITARLAELRAGYLDRAAAEVAAADRELAACAPAGAPAGPVAAAEAVGGEPDPAALEPAVELLVAAVLAEPGE